MSTIAIIEDDQMLAEMYQMKLGKAGYECAIATDGKQGLELIRNMKPDLVLLDLLLPELSGEEILKEMRANEWGKDIKVMVMTNVSENEASPSLKQLDVLLYIVKALYTPSQVLKLVKKVIKPKS